jgi:hypothetical protein
MDGDFGSVVWVNGPFGAGKTSLADALIARWPQARLFDPEEVGFMLRTMVSPADSGDFQDLPIWRDLVADTAYRLLTRYGRPLVVPMTVVVPAYLSEIFTSLAQRQVTVQHFFLKVSAQTLRKRIDRQQVWPDDPERDAEVRAWRLAQVERCVAAVDSLRQDTVLLDGELPTVQLANQVLEMLAMDRRGLKS